jgi:steroid 5-alpha reductase family enzyme
MKTVILLLITMLLIIWGLVGCVSGGPSIDNDKEQEETEFREEQEQGTAEEGQQEDEQLGSIKEKMKLG